MCQTLHLGINELFKRCEGIKIHMVVRNGYKVVASFYNKFQELMYPENNISLALSAFRNKNFDHPLDKTFWRFPQNPGFMKNMMAICALQLSVGIDRDNKAI